MDDTVIIDPNQKELHWADYVVFVIFLVLTAVLGVIIGFLNRKKATSKEFLQAGSDMHFVPVAFSIQASFLSAIFMVSFPAESYNFGITYSFGILAYFIAYPIIGKIFLPVYFELKITSAYEYLEIRFNRTVRIAASIIFMAQMLLYVSTVVYTPAVIIQQVTPLPTYACILIVGVVCIIYTVAGGMRATIWNDVIQMCVILVMLGTLIGFGHKNAGSIQEVFDIAVNGSRMRFNVFDPDPRIRTTFWTQVVGGTFMNFAMYAASQTIIQKALSTNSLKNAQNSLTVLCVTATVFMILVMWLGIVMFAYYKDCDPLSAGFVEKPDQLVPYFMMDVMGHLHGLPGLFLAAAFSGALSSVSGCLNAMAGVTLVDFISPVYLEKTGHPVPDRIGNILSRVLALLYGLGIMGLAFAVPYMGNLILQIAGSIFGMLGGPLTGVVAAGMLMPCVNTWGAFVGLLISVGITMWVGLGTMINGPPIPTLPHSIEGCIYLNTSDNYTSTMATYDYYTMTAWTTSEPSEENDVFGFYKLSYMYYGLVAIGVAMLVAFLVSAMSGLKKDVPNKQIYSCADRCYSCCPPRVKDCCRCGSLPPEEDPETEPQVLKIHFSKSSGEKVAGFDHPVRQTSFILLPSDESVMLKPSSDPTERKGSWHTELFHSENLPEKNPGMPDVRVEMKASSAVHQETNESDNIDVNHIGLSGSNTRNDDDSGISATNEESSCSDHNTVGKSHDNMGFDATDL